MKTLLTTLALLLAFAVPAFAQTGIVHVPRPVYRDVMDCYLAAGNADAVRTCTDNLDFLQNLPAVDPAKVPMWGLFQLSDNVVIAKSRLALLANFFRAKASDLVTVKYNAAWEKKVAAQVCGDPLPAKCVVFP